MRGEIFSESLIDQSARSLKEGDHHDNASPDLACHDRTLLALAQIRSGGIGLNLLRCQPCMMHSLEGLLL